MVDLVFLNSISVNTRYNLHMARLRGGSLDTLLGHRIARHIFWKSQSKVSFTYL